MCFDCFLYIFLLFLRPSHPENSSRVRPGLLPNNLLLRLYKLIQCIPLSHLLFNNRMNSSSVNPAFFIAALIRPILSSFETGIVIICPFGILILTWSPLPLLLTPPAFTKAFIAYFPLISLSQGNGNSPAL